MIATLSFILSATAVVISVNQASKQATSCADQFDATTRATRYNDIVGGLASSAAAVQQNSMRLLVAYAEDGGNYASVQAQQLGARDAIQVLTAFIEDNSIIPGRSGLGDYESPQPIILSRAIVQLKILAGERPLGSHSADVSRGNFHGVSLPYFRPNGSFLAVAADFRSADLRHLDLSAKSATLNDAFFTCASLQHAKFREGEPQWRGPVRSESQRG